MTVKLSISLTDQQAEFAKRLVDEGRFSSTSAVIQHALEMKRREDDAFEEWRTAFFAELDRRASEPTVDLDTFRAMVDDMLEQEGARLEVAD